MKKCLLVLVSTVFLACNAVAEQRVGPLASLMASAGDEAGSAYGLGVKYEALFNENVGLDVHLGYLNDGDMGLIPLEVGPIIVFALESVSLSLGAGAAYGVPTDGEADPALGFYASGGIRGPMSQGMEWFAELQYVSIKGDEDSSTTFNPRGFTRVTEAHLDFTAVGVNLGILWTF